MRGAIDGRHDVRSRGGRTFLDARLSRTAIGKLGLSHGICVVGPASENRAAVHAGSRHVSSARRGTGLWVIRFSTCGFGREVCCTSPSSAASTSHQHAGRGAPGCSTHPICEAAIKRGKSGDRQPSSKSAMGIDVRLGSFCSSLVGQSSDQVGQGKGPPKPNHPPLWLSHQGEPTP